MKQIRKLLVANRGEIGCRIFRTCERMDIQGIAIYTEHDAGMPHMQERPAKLVSNYLHADEIIAAAKELGADAIHPGYGFLAENADFARACDSAGIIFVGPSPEAMTALGDKSKARDTAKSIGVPVAEGLGPFTDASEVESAVGKLGAPVMLKAAAGGGGKGMKKLLSLDGLREQVEASKRETAAAFGDDRLIVERYIYPARHIEVQIFGDGNRAIALGERECSLQRRHQKIIEESPSTAVNEELRSRLFAAATKLAESTGYKNAGTVEFLLGPDGGFYFLEVNTRLQVEHPVTEMCTGLDLVRMQIEIAQGEPLMKQEDVKRRGHAIEARVNAEDPYNGFLPSAGKILFKHTEATWARIDSGIGDRVTTAYDSLLLKAIAHGESRNIAIEQLKKAVRFIAILGVYTNQPFILQLLDSEFFKAGETFTSTIDEMEIGKRPMPEPLLHAAALALDGPKQETPNEWRAASPWRLA